MPGNAHNPRLVDPVPALPDQWSCPFCQAHSTGRDGQPAFPLARLNQDILRRGDDRQIFQHIQTLNRCDREKLKRLIVAREHTCRYRFSLSGIDSYVSCETMELYWSRDWVPIDTILLGQFPKQTIDYSRHGYSILNFLTRLNTLCYPLARLKDLQTGEILSWHNPGVQALTLGLFIGVNQWLDLILRLTSVDLFCLFTMGAHRNPCASLADVAFVEQIEERLQIPPAADKPSLSHLKLKHFPLTNFDLEHFYQLSFCLRALKWVFTNGKTHSKLRQAYKFILPKLVHLLDKLEDGFHRYYLPLEDQVHLDQTTANLIRELTHYRVDGTKEQISQSLALIRPILTNLNSTHIEDPGHFVYQARAEIFEDDGPSPAHPRTRSSRSFFSRFRVKKKK